MSTLIVSLPLERATNATEWAHAVTSDGSLSAHFEHTVAVTKSGPLVLTRAASRAR